MISGLLRALYLSIAVSSFVFVPSGFAAGVSRTSGAASTSTWHVKEAVTRYRIEKDDAYARMPDVSLLDLPFAEGSSPKSSFRYDKRSRSRYFRLGAKMYYDGIGVYSAATAAYKVEGRYGRFVAMVGVDDRADSGDRARVEVQADGKTLYESQVLRAQINPVTINVVIRRGTKELKLITKDFQGGGSRRTVDWVNAGFSHAGSTSSVSYVQIPIPGAESGRYDVVVVTRSGRTVPGRIISGPQDESIGLFFDSTRGGELYYVYLVQKAALKATTRVWQGRAGLVLETRYTNSLDSEKIELADLMKAWPAASPVGWSLVDSIHHAYPIHRLADGAGKSFSGKNALALYRYTGYFNVDEAGDHTFATSSLWGSWVLIDDKLVVAWPGKHTTGKGRRGEQQADVALRPGVHKIEYLNFSAPGKMFTTTAWKKPEGKLRIMGGRDFEPVERWRAGQVGHVLSWADPAIFQWRITDDVRLEDKRLALIAIEFEALGIEGESDLSFNWDFGDGLGGSGQHLRHVFAGPGPRRIKLSILKNGRTFAAATQTVNAHVVWAKAFSNLYNVEPFEEALAEGGLDKLTLKDLVCVFDFADAANRAALKKQAAFAMVARADRAASREEYRKTCLKAAAYLRSPQMRRYDFARKILSALAAKSQAGSSSHFDILLAQAQLLNDCFGESAAAMEAVQKLKRITGLSGGQKRSLSRIQLETSAGAGSRQQVDNILARTKQTGSGKEARMQRLRHAGYLNHARQLLEHETDPLQLDYAMEKIESILGDDPAKVFDCELNLVKLDIHLARQEYSIAFHLAERLNKLDLSEHHRPQILLRKIRALGSLKDIAGCRETYRQLAEDYAGSSVLEEARKIIVAAVISDK